MRRVACLGLCILLSGCSAFPDIFSPDDGDAAPTEVVAETPPPSPAAAQPDDSFCRGVAAHDVDGYGFDDATKARVAQQSYAQCRAQFAR